MGITWPMAETNGRFWRRLCQRNPAYAGDVAGASIFIIRISIQMTLNIASVFQIPMLFIVEDNQYAMSTRREDAISGDIAERIRGFAVETLEIASTDTDELLDFFEKAFRKLDTGNQPVCAVVHNFRLGAHSKGDDTRDAAEIERHMQWDPIAVLERKLGRDEVGRRLRRLRKWRLTWRARGRPGF